MLQRMLGTCFFKEPWLPQLDHGPHHGSLKKQVPNICCSILPFSFSYCSFIALRSPNKKEERICMSNIKVNSSWWAPWSYCGNLAMVYLRGWFGSGHHRWPVVTRFAVVWLKRCQPLHPSFLYPLILST